MQPDCLWLDAQESNPVDQRLVHEGGCVHARGWLVAAVSKGHLDPVRDLSAPHAHARAGTRASISGITFMI